MLAAIEHWVITISKDRAQNITVPELIAIRDILVYAKVGVANGDAVVGSLRKHYNKKHAKQVAENINSLLLKVEKLIATNGGVLIIDD